MVRKLNLLAAGLMLCLVAAAFAGCDGDGGADCSEVTNPCDEQGAKRCSADSSGTEICGKNADGCLVWQAESACLEDQECTATADGPVCRCASTCFVEGATQCSADIIQTCTTAVDGCMGWVDGLNCADTSEECLEVGGSAICSPTCTDDCTSAGERQCNVNVIEICQLGTDGCMDWALETDCAEDSMICDDTGDEPECVTGCTDECETEDATQCNDTVIETCEEHIDGCLYWISGTDCDDDDMLCDIVEEEAQCIPVCYDDCENADDTRCGATVTTMIQTCQPGEDGCLDWVDYLDCDAFELPCTDAGGEAECETGSGDSCDDVMVIYEIPFTMSGEDFTDDFTNLHVLGDESCETRSGTQVEAVFSIGLTADQTVVVQEHGALEAALSIQSSCGDAGVCLVSGDFGTDDGPATYTAEGDVTVFIVIEAWYEDPDDKAYEISIEISEPEDCGDGIDNDLDDLADCDDSDCFGDETWCTVELNCHDGADNDADELADCADTDDCGESPWCAPYRGYWEAFSGAEGDGVDVDGYSLLFTPDPEEDNLYSYEYDYDVIDFPYTPGDGSSATALELEDSDYEEYTFTEVSGFTFFGVTYAGMFVGSNGTITFVEGDPTQDSTVAAFFNLPRIAGFDLDLDPDGGSAGTITIDEYSDMIVVTFDDVPRNHPDELVSFQVIMNADGHAESPGAIGIYYVDIEVVDGGMIGIANGAGDGTYPDETDLVPPPPPPPPRINEVLYDSPTDTDTEEFIELSGDPGGALTGHTLVHFNGSDGSVVWAIDLGAAVYPGNGLLVIGPAGGTNVDITWTAAGVSETDALQDGGESLVLYTAWDPETSSGVVVDAVAWEDDDNLFGEGDPAVGIGSGDWRSSIGRYPDGLDTDDNATDFVQAWWGTPGLANTPAQPAGHERITGSVMDTINTYPVSIPDDNDAGVDLTMVVDETMTWFPGTVNNIHVGLRLTHEWIGDLVITLTSPTGTSVVLHDNTGGSSDDIVTVFDFVTAVDDDTFTMASFDGETTLGTWTLNVADTGSLITGEAREWVLWVQDVP
ncbi:MAG: proprotein convertase P-domain-containing protein [Pseudomonadota bacterium]